MSNLNNKKIRINRKWQSLIMNTLMALILSVIISLAMTWMQHGLGDGYWSAAWTATWQSFIVALPAANIISYLVQKMLDNKVKFYDEDER